jgi:hypothetical protein
LGFFGISKAHEHTCSRVLRTLGLNVSIIAFEKSSCPRQGLFLTLIRATFTVSTCLTPRKATRFPCSGPFLVCHTFKELPGLANSEAAYCRDVGIGHYSPISIHSMLLMRDCSFLLFACGVQRTILRSRFSYQTNPSGDVCSFVTPRPTQFTIQLTKSRSGIPTAFEGAFKFFLRGVCLYICDLICFGRARSPA